MGMCKRIGQISRAESNYLSIFVFWLWASQEPSCTFSPPPFSLFLSCALAFFFSFKDIMARWTRKAVTCRVLWFCQGWEIRKVMQKVKAIIGGLWQGWGQLGSLKLMSEVFHAFFTYDLDGKIPDWARQHSKESAILVLKKFGIA